MNEENTENKETKEVEESDPQLSPTTSDQDGQVSGPEESAEVATPPKTKRFSKKKKLIVIGATLVVLIGAAAGWYLTQNKDATNQQAVQQTAPTPAPVEEKPLTPSEEDLLLQRFINPTTGEVWLPVPKKIANQGFLKDSDGTATEYYEIGKRGENTIIMSIVSMLGDDIRLYEKGKDGKVTFISRPDGDAVYNEDYERYHKDSFIPSVVIDKSTHYDSLTLPRKIDLDKTYKLTKPVYASLGDFNRTQEPRTNMPQDVEIKKVGQSRILRRESTYADVKLTSIGYVLVTPINTSLHLGYEPLEQELKGYQWQRGNSYVDDAIRAISRGCGGFYTSVSRADAVTDGDVQEVGKSPSGLQVYEFKNNNHVLLQKAYEEFTEYSKDASDLPHSGISKDDFIKQHAVLLHKDKFGQWLIYTREELRPAYGCAKPVIYLYPEVEQRVSVKVGADVKVSDPLYDPKTGWNVVASTNGSLNINGSTYDSLFWEGPGIGQYPAITNGFLVPRQLALPTIRQHLGQLGLNAKETDDFIEYWQDKLPQKPYVRLTWLVTADLDQLAPLYISPQPDTVIRVFLDFAGFDEPIQLPPQTLTAIPRKGFTVIEWGGLSGQKLY